MRVQDVEFATAFKICYLGVYPVKVILNYSNFYQFIIWGDQRPNENTQKLQSCK